MSNQIAQLPESIVFGHPERYQNLFSTFYEPGQGGNILVGTLPPTISPMPTIAA